jgi:hypothetical protein
LRLNLAELSINIHNYYHHFHNAMIHVKFKVNFKDEKFSMTLPRSAKILLDM